MAIADLGSDIDGFPDWAEQLIAESTGKLGKGVLPVAVEGPSAPEVRWPAPDVVVGGLIAPDASIPPTGVGEPWVTVSGTLGAQFLTWETATAVAGRMLGINPFDQPDVESAKKAARGLLDEQPERRARSDRRGRHRGARLRRAARRRRLRRRARSRRC